MVDPLPAAPDHAPRSRAAAALGHAVTLAVFFAAHANWRTPVLRLGGPVANGVVFAAALAMPWLALLVAGRVLWGWRQGAHAVALAPLLLYTLPLGSCTAMHVGDVLARGVNYAFEPIRALALGPSRVRVYRTNCGATCDFGVVVRQERRLVSGVLLVRDLGQWSHAKDAVVVPAPGGVQVRIVPTSARYEGRTGPQRLPVRPWVYF